MYTDWHVSKLHLYWQCDSQSAAATQLHSLMLVQKVRPKIVPIDTLTTATLVAQLPSFHKTETTSNPITCRWNDDAILPHTAHSSFLQPPIIKDWGIKRAIKSTCTTVLEKIIQIGIPELWGRYCLLSVLYIYVYVCYFLLSCQLYSAILSHIIIFTYYSKHCHSNVQLGQYCSDLHIRRSFLVPR